MTTALSPAHQTVVLHVWDRWFDWASPPAAATLLAMAAADVELLRRAWAAFARGDIEAATDVLDPRVRWYGSDAQALAATGLPPAPDRGAGGTETAP